jgi:hypothetical protein
VISAKILHSNCLLHAILLLYTMGTNTIKDSEGTALYYLIWEPQVISMTQASVSIQWETSLWRSQINGLLKINSYVKTIQDKNSKFQSFRSVAHLYFDLPLHFTSCGYSYFIEPIFRYQIKIFSTSLVMTLTNSAAPIIYIPTSFSSTEDKSIIMNQEIIQRSRYKSHWPSGHSYIEWSVSTWVIGKAIRNNNASKWKISTPEK